MRDGIAMSKDEGMRDIEATRLALDRLFRKHAATALAYSGGASSVTMR